MPFVPSTMTGLILSKAAFSKMAGQKLMPIITAVSSATCSYIPTSAVVLTTNVVLGPGAGTYTGKVVGCIPSLMSSLMMTKAAMGGLTGKDMKKLFDAISFGVCQVMLTLAMAQGTVIGGGPGAGQGKITNLIPSVLQQLIIVNMGGKKLFGAKTVILAGAIAFGICNHIMTTGTVITSCIGTFTPPPFGPVPIPAAPGPGRLI